MTFTKESIIDFKSEGRSYITWRTYIKPEAIKKCFYNEIEDLSLKHLFPNANIEYCHCDMYSIVSGDYKLGIKYICDDSTYYMFISANTFWAYPQSIAIGKAVNGKIYLIRESFPNQYSVCFRIIPEEYINKNEKGYRPRSYEHFITYDFDKITDEDINCIKIAYEGVKAFDKLIQSVS